MYFDQSKHNNPFAVGYPQAWLSLNRSTSLWPFWNPLPGRICISKNGPLDRGYDTEGFNHRSQYASMYFKLCIKSKLTMTILLSRVGVECCVYPVLAIQLKLLLQQKQEGEPTVAQTSRPPQLKSILEQTPAWRHKFSSYKLGRDIFQRSFSTRRNWGRLRTSGQLDMSSGLSCDDLAIAWQQYKGLRHSFLCYSPQGTGLIWGLPCKQPIRCKSDNALVNTISVSRLHYNGSVTLLFPPCS